jgi:hypothetical protein
MKECLMNAKRKDSVPHIRLMAVGSYGWARQKAMEQETRRTKVRAVFIVLGLASLYVAAALLMWS